MRFAKLTPVALATFIFACNKGKPEAGESNSHQINSAVSIVKNSATKKYFIKAGEKIVGELDAEFSYEPKLIGTFRSAPPYERVILVQEFPMGNACEGGDVHLIGISRDGESAAVSDAPNCGIPNPIVDAVNNKIIFPAHPTSRGETIIPKTTYQFKDQELRNISLPVSVSFRKAMFGDGMVLILKNTSIKSLSLVIRIYDPTTKERKAFKMVPDPNGTVKEFGHMEGWAFATGQEIVIENNDYEPSEIKVP